MISTVPGVITVSEPSWIPRWLVWLCAGSTAWCVRCGVMTPTSLGGIDRRRGQPWGIPPGYRVLLVAAYWPTNRTLRQLAPLFGLASSAGRSGLFSALRPPRSGFARTPCSSWRALLFPPATTPLRSCHLRGARVAIGSLFAHRTQSGLYSMWSGPSIESPPTYPQKRIGVLGASIDEEPSTVPRLAGLHTYLGATLSALAWGLALQLSDAPPESL